MGNLTNSVPLMDGVWAVIERDHYEYIARVYPDEESALRSAVEAGWGRVAFISWGSGVALAAFPA